MTIHSRPAMEEAATMAGIKAENQALRHDMAVMARPSSLRPAYTLFVLMIVYAISFVDRTILYVLAPSIQQDLRLSDTQLGLLGGFAFALFYATMGLPIARLAERYSRVAIISIALAGWSVMTAACGLAANFSQLFLARMGIGVGEGACTPSAQSMICDLYPPAKRATALGIYSMGVPIGVLLGSAGGAGLAYQFGWRAAFILAAVPGLLVASLMALTIKDPKRGQLEDSEYTDDRTPSFGAVVRRLRKSKSFRHVALGYSIAAIPGTSIQIFIATFMVRNFGLPPLQAGLSYGIVAGIMGAIGMFLGGRLTDLFARRDIRAYGWVPVLGFAVTLPCLLIALSRSSALAFGFWMVLPGAFYVFNVGASFAIAYNAVEPRMRATASAIFLMIITILGSGFGPVLLGWLSDFMAAQAYGASYSLSCLKSAGSSVLDRRCGPAAILGLKYALIAVSFFFVWASIHYLKVASILAREQAQGRELQS